MGLCPSNLVLMRHNIYDFILYLTPKTWFLLHDF